MGTGSGVNAILAASKSANVLGVDINPSAVECARQNAARNGVSENVTVIESDVFSAVEDAFDLIIFDPPFRWFAPRDIREVATADEGYRTLTPFFRQVPRYLEPDGRILLFFGTSGDSDYLHKLIKDAHFKTERLATRQLSRDGLDVEYFTYKLMRVRP